MTLFSAFIFEEMNTNAIHQSQTRTFSQAQTGTFSHGIGRGNMHVVNSRTLMPINTTLQMPLRTGMQSVVGMPSAVSTQNSSIMPLTQNASIMPLRMASRFPTQVSSRFPAQMPSRSAVQMSSRSAVQIPSQPPTQKYRWGGAWATQKGITEATTTGGLRSGTRSAAQGAAQNTAQGTTQTTSIVPARQLPQSTTQTTSWFYAQPPLRSNTFSSVMGSLRSPLRSSLRSSLQNSSQSYSVSGTSSSSLQMPPRMQYDLTYRLPPRMPPAGTTLGLPSAIPPPPLPPPSPLRPLTIILVNTSISPSDERHKILLPLTSIRKPLALMTGDYKMCINGRVVGKFHIDGSGGSGDYGVETSVKGVYWNQSLNQLTFTRILTLSDLFAILRGATDGPYVPIPRPDPDDIIVGNVLRSTEEPTKYVDAPAPINQLLNKVDIIVVDGKYIRADNVRRLVFDIPSNDKALNMSTWEGFCAHLEYVEDIEFSTSFHLPYDCSAGFFFAYCQRLNNITVGKNFFPIEIVKAAVGMPYLIGKFTGMFLLLDNGGKEFSITISDGTVSDALKLGSAFSNTGMESLGIKGMERPSDNVLLCAAGGGHVLVDGVEIDKPDYAGTYWNDETHQITFTTIPMTLYNEPYFMTSIFDKGQDFGDKTYNVNTSAIQRIEYALPIGYNMVDIVVLGVSGDGMFSYLPNVEVINLGGFTAQNAIIAQSMFRNCGKVYVIYMTSLNTRKVSEMQQMFYDCARLQAIYIGADFVIGNNTLCNDMFRGVNQAGNGVCTIYGPEARLSALRTVMNANLSTFGLSSVGMVNPDDKESTTFHLEITSLRVPD